MKSDTSHSDHRVGHRERMRQRFREHGLRSFQDYEALELLLLYVARQKDMKPVAKRLIERFGSFKNVLDASTDDLLTITAGSVLDRRSTTRERADVLPLRTGESSRGR